MQQSYFWNFPQNNTVRCNTICKRRRLETTEIPINTSVQWTAVGEGWGRSKRQRVQLKQVQNSTLVSTAVSVSTLVRMYMHCVYTHTCLYFQEETKG